MADSRNQRNMSQPTKTEGAQDDSFARVTWTDLAKGKSTTGKRKNESMDSGNATAEYSLAQHNQKNAGYIEAIDEEDDVLSGAQSANGDKNADANAP